ncbi:MAG: hypothetical protein KAJ19_09460 [Gammaproteobacteria bacterium]|nr:hypothetical protein [Gammaproteobacteria bacterium]
MTEIRQVELNENAERCRRACAEQVVDQRNFDQMLLMFNEAADKAQFDQIVLLFLLDKSFARSDIASAVGIIERNKGWK